MYKRTIELIELTEKWGEERNFYSENGTTPEHQYVKLMEEFGESAASISRGKNPKDDIGDQVVVLTHIARLCGTSLKKERFEVPLSVQIFYREISLQHNIMYLSMNYGDLARAIFQRKSDVSFGIMDIELALEYSITRLNSIAACHNLTLEECLEHSYNEIKDRKGKMVNSTFIKDSDL